MNNVIIQARELTKVYRLYSKPQYRFLDMFGLLGKKRGAFTEHAALDGVNLDIRRGEKVAVIGRNGAGKSTFLKLVTQVTQPTSGQIKVRGKVHALLQIGTGFHPDFTGRENVYAYLAQLGVTGREADRKCAEIIEFAELEEYIDQPVKTYSTGMGARLMFSTSTAITPNLLVLDEVLGVGDAYFTQKSYERIRELCEGEGTTLLLVTHDIYSASKICDRVIWIDRGRVLMDGNAPTVIKAYEDSIRAQEEQRLRLRKQAKLQELKANHQSRALDYILLEIRSRDNKPQPCPVYFSEISLYNQGVPIASLPLGVNGFDNEDNSHLQQEGTSWGDTVFWEGRQSRPMLNYGSPFHKVAGVFVTPGLFTDADKTQIDLLMEYWSDEPCDLVLRAFIKGREIDLGPLPPTKGQWIKHSVQCLYEGKQGEHRNLEPLSEINTSGVYGSGVIVVQNVKTVDDCGKDTHFLSHGKGMSFLIEYQIVKPTFNERAQVIIVLHKDGVQDVCRFITRDLLFDATKNNKGIIRLNIPRLMLGAGTYSVTIMVVKEKYFDQEQTIFFSINPSVYAVISKVIDIQVTDGGLLGSGTIFVGHGEWSMDFNHELLSPYNS
ncbi:ATP-binding cassette domain-containing protein [Microcoleus sp. FACHB-53]|nr:ATP-binding cassette domain-containing protein [Microcoleus sp. FACHB-53]